MASECFAFGYAVGWHFAKSQYGACNGMFEGISADYSGIAALQVDDCDVYGVSVSNSEFVAFDGKDSEEVVVSPTATGRLSISNTAFWGPTNSSVALVNGSSSAVTQFIGCNFLQYGANATAVRALGGDVSVTSCTFGKFGGPSRLYVGDQVQRAVVANNIVHGSPAPNHGFTVLANESQVGLNVG
mmetsp:Transcript_46146/g.100014  ORF Transcript_46146/g.100014 Transcript_46146/m.100014 type:complete len:186 (+) Transcript_46146:150-707(+)